MVQIKLKRFTAYKGNAYYAGVYRDIDLPEAIRNNPDLVIRSSEGVDLATPNYHNSLKEQKVKVGGSTPNQKKDNYNPPKPVILEEEKEKLNIATATVDQLAAIDGITMSTAQKVLEEREKGEFGDYADLDKRVPLKGNRKWENFSDRISLN
ncbi:MAG: helix-hairpin-helix domain-containing protein [Pleurocapsa sp. MO_226.B13]|nr:helix-hairpin-helix domain-containing protein [Pleurocapsa sp. MO_226.B13]